MKAPFQQTIVDNFHTAYDTVLYTVGCVLKNGFLHEDHMRPLFYGPQQENEYVVFLQTLKRAICRWKSEYRNVDQLSNQKKLHTTDLVTWYKTTQAMLKTVKALFHDILFHPDILMNLIDCKSAADIQSLRNMYRNVILAAYPFSASSPVFCLKVIWKKSICRKTNREYVNHTQLPWKSKQQMEYELKGE
ncbi:hypothetical protein SJAG_00672 [Schizosaccharomyces japonicus yFS275]|uniref:Uncharacterized protein n=1 Tax=Schizosaccharomyces japonicus (strain yFS275 / FY16936) TaxID=402676 RepID=B6JW99_SCHJY|nr:hypothetical protein SJAG_00672 [Schizosaccharomyces japonicus yFS275]EEB05650.1 hypothetical protein SJAG_00672 [Schizosaccharomyces japonicus yFS275]